MMRTLRMILISDDGNRSLERTIDVDWNVMIEMPMQLQDLQARMDALQDPAMGIVQNSPQKTLP